MKHNDYELILHAAHSQTVSRELVSVVVSLFNYERFIRDCLDSVLRQTVADMVELVVVDDCSDIDRSCEVTRDWMEEHAAQFRRVVLIRHSKNHGLAETRNTGFQIATSDFVLVLDADNMIFPRAIARLLSAIEDGNEGAAYSQLELFGAERGLGDADVWSKERFKRGNYVDAMALVRKTSWATVGGYTHIEGGWEDYDFWCQFIDHDISALFVPEILCRYRVHGASMLHTKTVKHHDQIKSQIKQRHPWLKLA